MCRSCEFEHSESLGPEAWGFLVFFSEGEVFHPPLVCLLSLCLCCVRCAVYLYLYCTLCACHLASGGCLGPSFACVCCACGSCSWLVVPRLRSCDVWFVGSCHCAIIVCARWALIAYNFLCFMFTYICIRIHSRLTRLGLGSAAPLLASGHFHFFYYI